MKHIIVAKKCAEEHEQLAERLEELKKLREHNEKHELQQKQIPAKLTNLIAEAQRRLIAGKEE